MICPHCGKAFPKRLPKALRTRALSLVKEGYSLRDVQDILKGSVSFSTISRWVRKKELE